MMTLGGAASSIVGMVLIALGARFVGLTIPFLILILYAVQKFYLRTSRQLRYLDLETQAPLMTHMGETIAGVSTSRAFGWQHQDHKKCLKLIDNVGKPFYLLLCVQRWLNLVLDTMTAAIAIIVVSMALTARGTATAGSVGVSLLAILSFNTHLTDLIVAWTTLETALGAVARCKNFEASTISENRPEENQDPPTDWPRGGKLTYRNVSASYSDSGDNVLHDISFSIAVGEKVGICGRSGSGKSSLILTLLRLLDHNAGSILLDDLDLARIPRHILRSRITTLPQEVLIVPGSVRDNLDPLSLSTPVIARDALRQVDLLTLIDARGGLEARMSDIALSHGQLQLFAVARAVLRPSKLLVLDEMTSSVDAESEERMLDVVRREFRDSSVIAVAHRLKTIVDFDKIVVLDQGRVVETGAPRDLLRVEAGWFRGMWDQSG